MTTVRRPKRKRRDPESPQPHHRGPRGTSLPYFPDFPTALSRSNSLDTLATGVPSRIRLIPYSGHRARATIRVELPEGTVVRLLVLDARNVVVDTPIDGWLAAGTHELRDLGLPDGAYKLRLETPTTWCVSGIMMG